MSDTPETDAARMFGYGEFGGDWVPLDRHHYEKHPEGDVIFSEVAERLERERDQAMMKFKELKRAAIEVLRIVPVAYCSEMYHGKRDMHSALDPCPVVERWNARIENLRALLKEEV